MVRSERRGQRVGDCAWTAADVECSLAGGHIRLLEERSGQDWPVATDVPVVGLRGRPGRSPQSHASRSAELVAKPGGCHAAIRRNAQELDQLLEPSSVRSEFHAALTWLRMTDSAQSASAAVSAATSSWWCARLRRRSVSR